MITTTPAPDHNSMSYGRDGAKLNRNMLSILTFVGAKKTDKRFSNICSGSSLSIGSKEKKCTVIRDFLSAKYHFDFIAAFVVREYVLE